MPRRDIVVIGASAGGVSALTDLVARLPADLPAAVFVVLHVPPYAVSRLPEILGRAGRLSARHARDGDVIRPGRILVAPPDRHLVLRAGRVGLTRGPRENHSRPAIDPLFRSAARAYGPRVVGVVLSGALYDGSAGLLAVAARGGATVVQDPEEAAVAGMPRSALELVDVEHVLPAREIGPLLERLARREDEGVEEVAMADDEERLDEVIRHDFATQAEDVRAEALTVYTCPDCGGVLWQDAAGPSVSFRCHVGHAFAPEVLLGLKIEELETALWSSVRLLREKATLTRQLAARSRTIGPGTTAERMEEQSDNYARQAELIQGLIEALPSDPDLAGVAPVRHRPT
jgi:two-component system chemotaxis response regulator CheB